MSNTLIGYHEATGKIDYTFTNDYMFRVILQTNELVLKGLISSLLHLAFDDIVSVQVENPIQLGAAISAKDFILDIRILLNNNTIVNLEMQVGNQHNWPDRSLSYLCRTFDQLCSGQDYSLSLPVIHIGILDFTLFPEHPEFYATYKLLNIKNHEIFNDKFILNVLSLKQIELATEEDTAWQIDAWAKLFAAKTWRDIKMIAENNEILTSATESLYKFNSDWIIREQCRAREDYERHERTVQRKLAEQEKALSEKAKALAECEKELVKKDALIKSLQEQLAKQNSL